MISSQQVCAHSQIVRTVRTSSSGVSGLGAKQAVSFCSCVEVCGAGLLPHKH